MSLRMVENLRYLVWPNNMNSPILNRLQVRDFSLTILHSILL